MKVLVSGFKGDTNSAKLIIDRIESKVPSIRNIENIDDLSKVFSNYIDSLT